MPENHRLPHFLLIGAGKSGTTSIHQYCDQHPDIFMSPVKETNFFELEGSTITEEQLKDPLTRYHYPNAVTSLNAYVDLFFDSTEQQILGETSPIYLYGDHAPENIRRHIPEVKIIAMLRNPVQRLYSRYLHLCRDGRQPKEDVYEILNRDSIWWKRKDFVFEGFYARHLSRYIRLFPKDNIKVILYDDFRKDNQGVMKEIFDFVGADPNFVPEDVEVNISGVPKNPVVDKLIGTRSVLIRAAKQISSTSVGKLKNQPVVQNLVKQVRQMNMSRPAMPRDLFEDINSEIYVDDIRSLEKLIDRDLSHWLVYK